MADVSKETNDLVVTAYKMGYEQALEKTGSQEKNLRQELENAEAHWEKICNSYVSINHQLRVVGLKYEAALQKIMDDCKWWSRDNWCGGVGCPCHIALGALEGKDE